MATKSDFGEQKLVTNSSGVTFDLNKDYTKAINAAKAAGQDTTQLERERQAKVDSAAYGGAYQTGKNQSSSYGTSYNPNNTAVNRTSNSAPLASTATQQPAQQAPDYSNIAAPLTQGAGYVTGGYTTPGVYGTPVLGDNPYWTGGQLTGTKADMSRRLDLANGYSISNGYTVYYDENGYAKSAVKGVADYTPHIDPNAQNGTYNSAGAWTDKEMMTDADFQAVQNIRAQLSSGAITGDQASASANAIRAKYGYTIDKNGYVTDSGALTKVNDFRTQQGLGTNAESGEQNYWRYLMSTDTSPVAQQAGQVKTYDQFAAINGYSSVPNQLNGVILGGGAPSSGGPGGSGAPNLKPLGPAGSAGSLINGNGTSANVGNAYNPGGLGDYLDQWLQNAQQQQVNKIDYGTNQAVLDLIRQQQDAQGVYQEQRNQIAIDEAKAKDNQALYAEARGDKGGIGQAQYDQIMATAAQNRLQVSQAQTKLATDTARQIADLRAQGEYEKADALLQLSQQYLSQLINLEQWSMEYNLSVAQFNASLQQWAAEYEMAVADITGNFRGAPTLKYQQYQDELALTQQNQMASAGETLLAAGIMPSASQLAAMGITQEQAQSYITAAQLAAAQKAKGSNGDGGSTETPAGGVTANLGTKDWYAQIGEAATAAGQSVDDYLYQNRSELGLTVEGVKTYLEGYNNWYDAGMSPDHFKASMNSLSSQLQAGALDGALANADRMWPDLGGDQRQQLQKLLATHGLAYNP